MTLGAGFVRVSTGSQNESSQIKIITAYAAEHDITVVKWFKLHGYSASARAQEPALREAIADIQRGDYTALIVTESSRLDRVDDFDAQAEILLAIRSADGDIISIAEPQFGKTDFAGRIVTLVAQHANLEKSKTVKQQTYRGIIMIRDNGGHRGALPAFWKTRGDKYAKQAYCTNPEAVKNIYERIANHESKAAIARDHNLWQQGVTNLIKFAANHTGVIECSNTHEGKTETWTHKVEPVVESSLWWRANKVLEDNRTGARANRGGRPIAWEDNWISGLFDCPACGGRLYLDGGKTRQGKPKTVKLRCGGFIKDRVSCKQYKGSESRLIIAALDAIFSENETPILSFQRIAGNSHELDALKAELPKLQAQLSVITDRAKRRETLAQIESLEDSIESFEVVADSYDHAPTGQTVGDMWSAGDTTVKRAMVRALKDAGGIALTAAGEIEASGLDEPWVGNATAGIVDLGGGLCFSRQMLPTGDHNAGVWPA